MFNFFQILLSNSCQNQASFARLVNCFSVTSLPFECENTLGEQLYQNRLKFVVHEEGVVPYGSNSMEHMEQLEQKIQDISEELKMIKLLKEEDLFYKNASERLSQLHDRFLSLSTNTVMKSIRDLTKLNPSVLIHNEADLISESKKHVRKHRLYASKLKFCTKIYSTLNEKLLEEIKSLKRLYTNSKDNINNYKVTTEEIRQLEAKIKRYDSEIVKLEKKYPWLTKETELKLPNIVTEVTKLEILRQQHSDLKSQLECYKGLSCDLSEAQRQLVELKSKYEQLNDLNK